MDNKADKDALIEALLQERDELYQELSKLRQMDGGVLERYEALIREKDHKISRLDEKVKKFEDKIKQLADQLSWLRRKFWKASNENTYQQIRPSGRLTLTGLKYFPKRRKQSRLKPVK